MIGLKMIRLALRPFLADGAPVLEGPFDFIVETSAYSDPSPEGPFDFVVEN